jgi:monovalent cation:proton antiporter-2 (CPA2) family protein
MNSHSFFSQAFVYLLSAVLAVPLAKRLGLGSVLGYLLAGVAIGPFVLGLTGAAGSDVMHYAEFGVVMMLFLIGLELDPAKLWQLRGSIFGLGGSQVGGVSALCAIAAIACGLGWKEGVAIGLVLAMSSTAIVLQSLGERGLLKTPGGQNIFSVLLFQDIAVIPILALLPLLGSRIVAADAHGIASLPVWARTLATLGAVALVILVGRYALRPIFRFIAISRLREVFTAMALLLIVGVILLMETVGLSPALGAFLAGVVLANSEYRHELEADIEPFKGLLLGLFFISVGANLDFALVASQPGVVAGIVAGLVVIKSAVHFTLSRIWKMTTSDSSLFSLGLAQGGEFAFVLLSFCLQLGVLPESVVKPLIVSVAITMAIAPLLLLVHERFVVPRLCHDQTEREPDKIDEHNNQAIVIGFGRFGHVVGRLLRANGYRITVLDNDGEQVDMLRNFGLKAFYGDATRLELLEAAGARNAKLIVLNLAGEERSLRIVHLVKEHFPHLKILARAHSREHAYELLNAGVKHVFRETLDSALALGVEALRMLGMRGRQAIRAARIFRELDEAAVREMAKVNLDSDEYVSLARKHIQNLDDVLAADANLKTEDDGWETGRR